MNLAIIPARGGSKRIPHKNIREFLGKPIIAYSITAALECGIFDVVMVSTDNEEIASVAKQYNAKVPFMRSEETSNDKASTASVLLEVIGEYKELGMVYRNICCVYPTAPFVTADKLQEAFDIFTHSDADALIPVTAFSYPPLRGMTITKNRVSMKWPEYIDTRSQDLEPLYHDCGQFYFIRTEALLREKNIFCKHTVPMIIPELEVQDIDNEDDWELAEMKCQLLWNKEKYKYLTKS